MNKLLYLAYNYSGEVSPERFNLAYSKIMEMVKRKHHRSASCISNYNTFFTMYFVENVKFGVCAETLGVSRSTCSNYRKRIIRFARHPSVRGVLFDEEYFSQNRVSIREEINEYDSLITRLSPRARNFVGRLTYGESIDSLVEIPPNKLISIRGYGAKTVKEVMLHIGEKYIPRWWPELAGTDVDTLDVYDLCIRYKEV